jgi:hypothetical protein
MKYTYITILAILAILTTSATLTTINPKEKAHNVDKNGIIYYMTNVNGTDTTYTIFSVYNVKENLEWEIGDTLISLYNQNKLPDFIDIKTSKGIVYGTCNVQTYQKATTVDYTVYKYKWNDGTIETIKTDKTKY